MRSTEAVSCNAERKAAVRDDRIELSGTDVRVADLADFAVANFLLGQADGPWAGFIKWRKGKPLVIKRGYESDLPGSTKFAMTMPRPDSWRDAPILIK